jgi:enoyl-CoA hydratase
VSDASTGQATDDASGPIRVVRIGRPERRNAVNSETAERLHREFLAFDADPEAKVAILTGDESAFCAGADLTALPRLRESGPMGPTRLALSKPVIAAIDGWCVAGGVELAARCDIRVAGAGAKFGCLERRWGVPLIDGGTIRLPRIVGLGRAMDLMLTGRGFDAQEAERIGFVTRLVAAGGALQAAIEVAEVIASSPWPAVVHDRLSAYESYGLTLEDALANEDRHGRAVIFDPDFAAGVAQFQANQAKRREAGDR